MPVRVASWLLRAPGGGLVLFTVRDEGDDLHVDLETLALAPGEPVLRIGYRLYTSNGEYEELWFFEVGFAGAEPLRGRLLDVTVEDRDSVGELLNSLEELLREAEVVAEREAWIPGNGSHQP